MANQRPSQPAASSFCGRGRLVGLVVLSDNEGSGRAHGPGLACKGLRKTAPLLCRSYLVAHETPCHSLLFGEKDHLTGESCKLFKAPLHSRDSVGKLGARIGHFPVDKGVLELPGPFCFVCHSLALGKHLSSPSLGLMVLKARFGWLGRKYDSPMGLAVRSASCSPEEFADFGMKTG